MRIGLRERSLNLDKNILMVRRTNLTPSNIEHYVIVSSFHIFQSDLKLRI
jgi:hypothetical protein